MRKLIILALLYAPSIHAQSPALGGFTKEDIKERDALNNDKSTPMAAEKATKEWNMNGGLHFESGTNGTRSGYSNRTKRTNSSTGTKSNSYSRDFLERRREARERAREEAIRKERERKERIARENAADFRNGYNAKMASSSAYYDEKRRNDRYRMGEGARKLDQEIQAKNYVIRREIRQDSHSIKDENELLDIMQNGITSPDHVRMHVNQDGYYDSVIDKTLISDKVEEAKAANRHKKEIEDAKQKAKDYIESLRRNNFDFNSLLSVISKAKSTEENDSKLTEKTVGEDNKAGTENEKGDSTKTKRKRTYEEYVYELNLNGGNDFDDDDWITFEEMRKNKEEGMRDELKKEQENNKNY